MGNGDTCNVARSIPRGITLLVESPYSFQGKNLFLSGNLDDLYLLDDSTVVLADDVNNGLTRSPGSVFFEGEGKDIS